MQVLKQLHKECAWTACEGKTLRCELQPDILSGQYTPIQGNDQSTTLTKSSQQALARTSVQFGLPTSKIRPLPGTEASASSSAQCVRITWISVQGLVQMRCSLADRTQHWAQWCDDGDRDACNWASTGACAVIGVHLESANILVSIISDISVRV